jgi:hypothetical protein
MAHVFVGLRSITLVSAEERLTVTCPTPRLPFSPLSVNLNFSTFALSLNDATCGSLHTFISTPLLEQQFIIAASAVLSEGFFNGTAMLYLDSLTVQSQWTPVWQLVPELRDTFTQAQEVGLPLAVGKWVKPSSGDWEFDETLRLKLCSVTYLGSLRSLGRFGKTFDLRGIVHSAIQVTYTVVGLPGALLPSLIVDGVNVTAHNLGTRKTTRVASCVFTGGIRTEVSVDFEHNQGVAYIVIQVRLSFHDLCLLIRGLGHVHFAAEGYGVGAPCSGGWVA